MDRCLAGDLLKGKFPEAVLSIEEFRGETSITVATHQIRDVMTFLKDSENLHYDLLLDLAGVDFAGQAPRFLIAYLLHSTKFNNKLRIKTRVAEDGEVDTVSDIWKAADWMEREAYDMFGIKFYNHPYLKRILLTEDFVGYPLRKDFPLEGPDFDQPFNVCLEEEHPEVEQ
ncbi:MAG: NADH-quinone oxidoreductase subunit C [Deltaproteobacteria bacterium]|nr:NADH-quinone oxidoreductase subunit C [Deltaproteobacteria bacterium]